jgi:hypothetical protein
MVGSDVSNNSKMNRIKNAVKMQRPWFIILGIGCLVAMFVVMFSLYQLRNSSPIESEADTSSMKKNVSSTPGGNATSKYRDLNKESNERKAEEASKSGKSFIPSVLSGDGDSDELSQDSQSDQNTGVSGDRRGDSQGPNSGNGSGGKSSRAGSGGNRSGNNADGSSVSAGSQVSQSQVRALQDQIRQLQRQIQNMRREQRASASRGKTESESNQERIERQASNYRRQMQKLDAEFATEVSKQKVYNLAGREGGRGGRGESEEDTSASRQSVNAGSQPQTQSGSDQAAESGSEDSESKEKLQVAPGDIVYARNELLLNSDSGGPAQATIVSGSYQGSKVLGGFEKKGDYLRVEFNRLVTSEGEEYSIEAYAIDPDVPSSAVRTDIDRHMLQRWGGLMAASFLAGFGEAVSESGSSVSVSDGSTTKAYPEMDMTQQLWTAGGKVGEELANIFRKKFERPATVTLRPGQNLGILFISTES